MYDMEFSFFFVRSYSAHPFWSFNKEKVKRWDESKGVFAKVEPFVLEGESLSTSSPSFPKPEFDLRRRLWEGQIRTTHIPSVVERTHPFWRPWLIDFPSDFRHEVLAQFLLCYFVYLWLPQVDYR